MNTSINKRIKIWLQAFRLRTLPLALANAIMGSFLALSDGAFDMWVFVLTMLTITFLQILSNLANDYGDAVSGADNAERVGPVRVTATGQVTRQEIKRMVLLFVALSVVAGSMLIVVGLNTVAWWKVLLFFGFGGTAILAAIKYTVGRNPYGYKGLGDLFVFLFFGILGVIGTYYLHTNWYEYQLLYPASAIGLMSVGVLNINNLRDVENDRKSGKNTLAVKYGKDFAKSYHLLLLVVAFLFAIIYSSIYYYSPWQFIFLLTAPLFIRNIVHIFKSTKPEKLNNELKNLALATFLFALLFGIGLLL